MKKITKTINIDVYTPQETFKELLKWHYSVFGWLKDKIYKEDKFDLDYINTDLVGMGLHATPLEEYLEGECNYYVDDFTMVFEQDDKLYMMAYLG